MGTSLFSFLGLTKKNGTVHAAVRGALGTSSDISSSVAHFVRLGQSLFFLIALAMVLGSTPNILPILINDIPKRCNSVAFWDSFWYK